MVLSEAFLSLHSEHLSAYKAACEEHPALKAYDTSLQEQTNKAAVKLADVSKDKVVSPYTAYKVVSQQAIDATEGVANFITESDFNFRDSKALRDLMESYFETTQKTMDIFTNIKKCVSDAEMGKLYIEEAVIEFNNENAEKNASGKKKRYERTLKCVKNFKDLGDPFSGIVLKNEFHKVIELQQSLLTDAKETKEKLIQEIADLEKARLIATAISGAAIAGLFIAAIALMATGFGAGVGVGVAAAAVMAAAGWAAAYSVLTAKIAILKKQLAALEKLNELEDGIDKAVKLEQAGIVTITPQVNVLEGTIIEMLKVADSATDDDNPEAKTKLDLELICGKVGVLTTEIKDVGDNADKCIKTIADARIRVMQKINS